MNKNIAQKVNALDNALEALFTAYEEINSCNVKDESIKNQIKRFGRMIETLEEMKVCGEWDSIAIEAYNIIG